MKKPPVVESEDEFFATLDICTVMIHVCFGKIITELDDDEGSAFWEICSERLRLQGANEEVIEKVISRSKEAISLMVKAFKELKESKT